MKKTEEDLIKSPSEVWNKNLIKLLNVFLEILDSQKDKIDLMDENSAKIFGCLELIVEYQKDLDKKYESLAKEIVFIREEMINE